MSRLQDEVKLVQPLPFFGAVKKPHRYGKWLVWTALLTMFTVAGFLAPTVTLWAVNGSEHSLSGTILSLAGIIGFVWLCYTVNVFSYSSAVFHSDALNGRDEWVKTELRSYLNQRYGTDITEKQAVNLLYWSGARITRIVGGREEQVRVVLTGLEPLKNCVSIAERAVYPLPDVSQLELELMIVEDPQKAKVYSFSQD